MYNVEKMSLVNDNVGDTYFIDKTDDTDMCDFGGTDVLHIMEVVYS